MSDISKCNECMKNPKGIEEIQDDLTVLEAKADFNRTNIFKWFLLYLFMVIISCIALRFLWEFFTNSIVQKYILDQIMNNIIFISLAVLTILKINIPNIKK